MKKLSLPGFVTCTQNFAVTCLLLLGGYTSCNKFQALKFCGKKEIQLARLRHTINRSQPLDKFEAFKSHDDNECVAFIRKTSGENKYMKVHGWEHYEMKLKEWTHFENASILKTVTVNQKICVYVS
jgi:Cft2 family RNA processing exonuclease